MKERKFFAVDLGATSGRTIVGTLTEEGLKQEVVTRFPNRIIHACGHYYWDIYALYEEILEGLRRVAEKNVGIESIGIDTWGCDFVMIGSDGSPLRNPYSYRDPHTVGSMEEFFKLCPREKLYEKTGIELMEINSLFQLSTLRKNGDAAFMAAAKFLFTPDALIYMLTGEMVCERTILSTSQLLNVHNGKIDDDLLRLLGLKASNFGRQVNPGEIVGKLSKEVQEETGLGAISVVAVAGHDTGAAVAAIPAKDDRFAYLSCGTWSLLGIETGKPIINNRSYELNFTNEAGVDGTTCVLKNICGLWLLERCRMEWEGREDVPKEIGKLNRNVAAAGIEVPFVNPDAKRFKNPHSMTEAISGYCRDTGQKIGDDYREIAGCIFQSLALRYRQVIEMLRDLAPLKIERLYVTGGGSQNEYLMQLTANSTRLDVIAGPKEGTAMGNLLIQAEGWGIVKDRFEMRKIVAKSTELKVYKPQEGGRWDKAYERYLKVYAED